MPIPVIGPIIGGIIGAVTGLIQLIQLFQAILALIQLFRKQDPTFDAGSAIKQARDAFADAKAGNPKPLEDQFDRLRKRCNGVACPPDLVGRK